MGQSIIGQPASVPAGGFFICDLPWAVPKDDMASMEHPLFTLATRPDRRICPCIHANRRSARLARDWQVAKRGP